MPKLCTRCRREYPSDAAFCETDGAELHPVLLEYASRESAVAGHVLDGRYLVDSLLGSGGMGIVVRARHLFLDRVVAVKLLHPELLLVEEVRSRFLREARTASALRDPHVVETSDFGVTREGLHYLVMEYLEGCDLLTFLSARGRLDIGTVLEVGLQACKALEVIHRHGFVHRDLKPENIWMLGGEASEQVRVKILDFGIAGIMAAGEGGEAQRLTRTGKTLGTPHYMAPEQGRGTRVDGRTDVYAIGCILWEIAVGRPAFEGSSALDILTRQIIEEPQAPSAVRADLPEWFDALVLRCMDKKPERRWQTAAELAKELGRHLTGAVHSAEWSVTRMPDTAPEQRAGAARVSAEATTEGIREAVPADPSGADTAASMSTVPGTAAAGPGPIPSRRTRPKWLLAAILAPVAAALVATAVLFGPAIFRLLGGEEERPLPADLAGADHSLRAKASEVAPDPEGAPRPDGPGSKPKAAEPIPSAPVVATTAPRLDPRPPEGADPYGQRRTPDPGTWITVTFDVKPPGAEIARVEGDATVPVGPRLRLLAEDGEHEYVISKPGYRTETRTISHRSNVNESIELRPKGGGRPAHADPGRPPAEVPPGIMMPGSGGAP